MEKAEDEDYVRTADVDDALVRKPTTAAVPEHSRTARTEGAAGDDDRAGKGQEPEDRPDEPADAPPGVPLLPVAIVSDTKLRPANPDSMTYEGGQSASQVRAHAHDRAGSKGAADEASTAAVANAPAEPNTARARSNSAAEAREGVADTSGARSAAETTRNETSRGAPGFAAEIGIAVARYAVPPRSDNAGAPRSGIRLSERSAALSLDRAQARQAADVIDIDNADAGPRTAVANDDRREISGSRSDRNDGGGDRNPDRRTIAEAGMSVSGTQAATVPPGAAPLLAPATGSPAAALSQAIALEPSWRPETVAAMTQAQVDALPRGPGASSFSASGTGTTSTSSTESPAQTPPSASDPQNEIAAIISSYLEI